MATVYLFRHARSAMNEALHLVGGRSNHTPLTEEGEAQAERLGLWIAHRGLRPDVVYASPAVRTLETARIALKSAGVVHNPVIDERLQELSQGIAEGKPKDTVYTEAIKRQIGVELKDFRLEKGESMNDVSMRKKEWLGDALVRQHATIFAFTHGFAIRCFVGEQLGWSHSEVRANDIDNAFATILEYDEYNTLLDVQFNIDTQTTNV